MLQTTVLILLHFFCPTVKILLKTKRLYCLELHLGRICMINGSLTHDFLLNETLVKVLLHVDLTMCLYKL